MDNKDKIPLHIKKRLDLAGMFYPLERKYQRRWAKLFKSDFNTIATEFKNISEQKNYQQENLKNAILWRDVKNSNTECMFYFINDPTVFSDVFDLFKMIKKFDVFISYAIVHQKKDGENWYDIFRLSKFSYLEHCNRVKYN